MRVLVVANNFPSPERPVDGVFNLRQLRALRELGHEAAVVRFIPWLPPLNRRWQPYRSVPDAYDVEGIPVRTLRGLIGPKGWGLGTVRYQLRGKMAEIIAEFRPDVLHVHGLISSGVLALEGGLPYVVTGHGSDTYFTPWTRADLERVARDVIAGASAVAGVSNFITAFLRKLGAAAPQVIYNGADPAVFSPQDRQAARERLQIPPQAPVVAYAGHLVTEKGVRELIDALILLRDLQPYAVLAGSGPLLADLEERCSREGIAATFYGSVGQERLADIYAAADVFTLPSYREGLPTVICEAMNAGRAVVATRTGGIPEIVRDGINGFVVESRNAHELAQRLRTVLTDSDLRDAFEDASYAFAREHLTWQKNALAYDAIYREIARKEASPVPFDGTGLARVSRGPRV
jgi:teichuronic acid biosynthesis glycosyltransferase TuaC